MSVIDNLLHGSIDIHIHHGPDPISERRVDALQGARQAQEAGMRAIVLKCHEYCTAPVAYIVSRAVPDIIVLGSITLNREVGGLNPSVLETSAKLGAKVVWMPTRSSTYELGKGGVKKEGITILDGKGKLLPVVEEILDIIKSYHMVLATGHLPVAEAFALVDEAKRKGLPQIVVTHPMGLKGGTYFSLEEQRRMAEKKVFIEHCFGATLHWKLDPLAIVEAIRTAGAEHCILSTDLGQAFNPTPAEGMRMMIAYMLRCGLSEKDVEIMVKVNPARLLGLD